MDARPWDFQAEECALRAAVDRFNSRRYGDASKVAQSAVKNDELRVSYLCDIILCNCQILLQLLPDFEPVDKCITSVLGRPVHLTSTFKDNYEVWLEQEVFNNPVDWDELIRTNGYI